MGRICIYERRRLSFLTVHSLSFLTPFDSVPSLSCFLSASRSVEARSPRGHGCVIGDENPGGAAAGAVETGLRLWLGARTAAACMEPLPVLKRQELVDFLCRHSATLPVPLPVPVPVPVPLGQQQQQQQ